MVQRSQFVVYLTHSGSHEPVGVHMIVLLLGQLQKNGPPRSCSAELTFDADVQSQKQFSA